jgi:hypothetical protein
MGSLEQEFQVIAAEHAVRSKMKAEIDLLRILLMWEKEGKRRTLDIWKVRDILEKYLDFRDYYELHDPILQLSVC